MTESSRKLSLQEQLEKHNMTRVLVVRLEDVMLSRNVEFNGDTATVNEERKKPFTCYVCMAKFTSALLMNKHKALHSESDLEDAKDDDEFLQQKSDKNSNNKVDPKNAPKPVNSSCDKALSSVDKSSDKPTSDGMNKMCIYSPFKCDTCDVYFNGSDDARLHSMPTKCKFSCRICNRKFNTLYAFVVHVMQHRSDTSRTSDSSQIIYMCTTCKKTFNNCLLLRSHEINVHQVKSLSTASISEVTTPVVETPRSNVDTDVTVKIEQVYEPTDTADESQATELCCDLCYDVFNSAEQLEVHMEFHKQLENKNNTILIEDDEEESVEVIEEKKDPHEIITTIKSKPKSVKEKTVTPFDLARPSISSVTTSNIPKQVLTKSIQKMLAPKVPTKTVLLPQPVEKLPTLIPLRKLKKKKPPQKDAVVPNTSNLELCKTGPFSFALQYKDDPAKTPTSSANPAMAATSIGLPATTTALSNTLPLYMPLVLNQNPESANQTPPTSTVATSGVVANPNFQFYITNVAPISGLQNTTPSTQPSTSGTVPTISVGNTAASSVPQFNLTTPIIVNNPTKQMAYFIVPHNNEAVLNQPVPTDPGQVQQVQTNVAPTQFIVTCKTMEGNSLVATNTYTTPTGQSTTMVSNSNNSVMSTKESSLPIITQISSFSGLTDNNAVSTATGSSSNIPAPEPSKLEEAIVVDSDSSDESNVRKSKKSRSQSDEDSDGLVIDESASSSQNDANSQKSGDESSGNTPKQKLKFPMKCDGCAVVFQRMRSKRQHDKRKHCCQMCDFKACKVPDLKEHYILEHRKFFCYRCSYLANSRRSFTEHNRYNHICEKCHGFYFNIKFHVCLKKAEVGNTGETSAEKE